MDTTETLLDLRKKRIEKLRSIYIKGESLKLNKLEIKKIFLARKNLIEYVGLSLFDKKIVNVTNYLQNNKTTNKDLDLVYIVFTKAFDFVLTYDKNTELKEQFIHYCNLLHLYIDKKDNIENKSNYEKLFVSIKNLTFDIQTLLFKLYTDENINK